MHACSLLGQAQALIDIFDRGVEAERARVERLAVAREARVRQEALRRADPNYLPGESLVGGTAGHVRPQCAPFLEPCDPTCVHT